MASLEEGLACIFIFVMNYFLMDVKYFFQNIFYNINVQL